MDTQRDNKPSSSFLLLSVLGGILFCLVFGFALRDVPLEWYHERDDALITLSHAKNWVDYGFIGVNPSGGIVEGFSAPLSFLLYTFSYGLFGIDFSTHLQIQTWGCTFLLGFLCGQICRGNLLWTLICGLLLSRCGAFMMWHGSGMENALMHVLAGWIMWSILNGEQKTNLKYALPFSIAMLIRVDGLYWISPLFLLCLYTHRKYHSYRSLLQWFGIVLLPTIVLHICRWLYFGDWLPNTAYAQDIHILERLQQLITLQTDIWHYSIFLGFEIVLVHGSILLFLTAPWFWIHRYQNTSRTLVLICITTLLVAFISPFLFGTARLSFERLTTSLPVFIILCIVGLGSRYRSWSLSLVLGTVALFPTLSVPMITFGGLSLLPRHKQSLDWFSPKEICCSITPIKKLDQEIKTITTRHALHRPMIAVPDVGYLTLSKEYNVIDLGKLAHPFLARNKDPSALSTYFFEVIAPDIVELHGDWLCMYQDSLLNDNRFDQMYEIVRSHIEPCPIGGSGLWVRKDILKDSRGQERELMMSMQPNITWQVFKTERDQCMTETPSDCQYIDRTIYLFTPELLSLHPEQTDKIQQSVQRLWNYDDGA